MLSQNQPDTFLPDSYQENQIITPKQHLILTFNTKQIITKDLLI